MAINSLEAIDILFNAVKMVLNDANRPTGGVYRQQRPINSVKEDIVITSLALDRDNGFQNGVLNVNIHVPNLTINANGVTDTSLPNISRLNYLTKAVESIIGDVYEDGWSYEVQQDNLFQEDKSSYNNIRIAFRALNY